MDLSDIPHSKNLNIIIEDALTLDKVSDCEFAINCAELIKENITPILDNNNVEYNKEKGTVGHVISKLEKLLSNDNGIELGKDWIKVMYAINNVRTEFAHNGDLAMQNIDETLKEEVENYYDRPYKKVDFKEKMRVVTLDTVLALIEGRPSLPA